MVYKKQNLVFVGLMIVLCFSASSNLWSQSNEGTNFWFGFMEHKDIGKNIKVAMITSKQNTSGVISIPNQNWSQDFTVSANDVSIIELPDYTENLGSEAVQDIGIQVLSQDLVSVYIHQYHSFRSEATVVLPVNSLGNEYYVMCYSGIKFRDKRYPSEFLIVASEDNTFLTITLSDDSMEGKIAGTTFNVTLNAGETYQVQSSSFKTFGDLTGTHISGNKNFALFGGNKWTQIPKDCETRDNLLEQMLPVNTWGKQVVTVPNIDVEFDVFRILASENNTFVTIHGTASSSFLIQAGEFFEYRKSEATFIDSNKPIQVAQFNIGSKCNGNRDSVGDPSMILLNSVRQTRDTVTLYNSTFQNITRNFINVIVGTEDFPFVSFDGGDFPEDTEINTVGLNAEYTYARFPVSAGAHTIISDACGIIATAYGYGELESYAYGGGASFNSININPIPEGACLGDTVYFDTKLSESRFSFLWDLGNGITTTESTFSYFYPGLGTHPVQLIITDECLGTSDTLKRDLIISNRQSVETYGDTLICQGESFNLIVSDLDSANYEWIGPNGYFSKDKLPVVFNAQPEMSGTYEVIGIVSGCATLPAATEVEVIASPIPDLGGNITYCNLDEALILDPGNFTTYEWEDGSDQSYYWVDEPGKYKVIVANDYGCQGVDSLWVKQFCPTEIFIPNVFSPNFDGTNDYFQVLGHDITQMRLRIYDRWGGLVFEANSPEERWDGTFKGEKITEGVYVWVLEIEGSHEYGTSYTDQLSGTVTLVR
jgi:gliding motility-associated-like protein